MVLAKNVFFFGRKNVIFDYKLLVLGFFLEILCQSLETHPSYHCYINIDYFGTKTCCQIPDC